MADFPGYDLLGMVASFFFVLLTTKQPDDLRVVGPAFPIVAQVGEDAVLTCQLLPKRTATHMEVRWYRSEPDTPLMAQEMGVQLEAYGGRVERLEDGLEEGRVSLKIRSIQPSDDGQYWCRFQEDQEFWGETSVLLQVAGLGSAPSIHMEGPGKEGVKLVCTARGWFPEPQVYWEAMSGERLMAKSEDHVPGDDGLFYVEDTLVVRNGSGETVSCFVHNPVLDEGREATISLPEKLQTELASFKVTGPSQPLLVRVGDDLELSCYLSPAANARSMEVRWIRAHRYPAVHVHVDGDLVAAEQMAEYRGRTSLVAIGEGRVALRIGDVRPSDDGWYRCQFEKDGVYQEATVEVKVFAVGSPPLLTREEPSAGQPRLRCTSDGWFPRPRVQWTDAAGRPAAPLSQELRPGPRGLFRVDSLLLLANSSAETVTCSVGNLPLGLERAASSSPRESSMACLWKALPGLGLLLALGVGLARTRHRPGEAATRDRDKAHDKGREDITHELSSSETPHRELRSSSQSPRRGSRHAGASERWRSRMGLGRS